MGDDCKCCNGISAFPYILITLGIILALGTFGIVDGAFGKLWPMLLVVWGAVKIVGVLLERWENSIFFEMLLEPVRIEKLFFSNGKVYNITYDSFQILNMGVWRNPVSHPVGCGETPGSNPGASIYFFSI